jgi:hypothetical protein
MLSRLDARLRRLEQQGQGTDAALGQGLSGLLAYARAHHIVAVPLALRTDTELGAEIEDLTAQVATGARGCTPLLLEALEKERARRQAACTREPQA